MKRNITVEGIKLAYVEVNPVQVQTLFFIHNNSGSSRIWAKQLEDPLLTPYRLIALDLPAHGDSAASDTPEEHYGLSDLGRIIGKAIQELTITSEDIVIGASLGTNIIVEALDYITPKGIVLTAPTIVGKKVNFFSIVKPDVNSTPLFTDTASQEAVSELFSSFPFSKDTSLLENILLDYHQVKPPFRSTLYKQSIENGKIADEITLLNKAEVPTLIIVGEEEEVIKPDYLDGIELNKWNNRIYKLPAAGHFIQLDQPKTFNQLLLEYSQEIFREPHV